MIMTKSFEDRLPFFTRIPPTGSTETMVAGITTMAKVMGRKTSVSAHSCIRCAAQLFHCVLPHRW
ncbi:MAG: hypothetical protein IKE03_09590 [Blautia sp.]|nr:hypothetical protein [Blautia sp.]